MDLELALALVGGVLILLVLMSPAADRGRRPVYTMVGTDRKNRRTGRGRQAAMRPAAPAMALARPVRRETAVQTAGAAAQPGVQPVAMATLRASAGARAVDADQLVAGLISRQRTA